MKCLRTEQNGVYFIILQFLRKNIISLLQAKKTLQPIISMIIKNKQIHKIVGN